MCNEKVKELENALLDIVLASTEIKECKVLVAKINEIVKYVLVEKDYKFLSELNEEFKIKR